MGCVRDGISLGRQGRIRENRLGETAKGAVSKDNGPCTLLGLIMWTHGVSSVFP